MAQAIKRISLKIESISLKIDDRWYVLKRTCSSIESTTTTSTSPHHPPPRYPLQHPQCNEFFYEEELHYPTYQYDDFEDDYKDEMIVYGKRRGFANPNPNRRGKFPNLNRRGEFPDPNRRGIFSYSFRGKRGYSNPDEFRILLLMAILILDHPYFGLIKLISYLSWRVFP